jgi:4-carboxymuconolactone decarboxylase
VDHPAEGPGHGARGVHQREVLRAGGARSRGDGVVHRPLVGGELGSALRYGTGLSDRVREVAILAVAAATGSAFELHAHTRVGRAAGLSEAELDALAARAFTSTDPAEQAAYDLCRRLLEDRPRLTDAEYADLVEALGTRTLTELVVLVGYYRTLAQLLDVFDVGVPEEPGPQ